MYQIPIDIDGIKDRLIAEEKRKKEGIQEENLVPKKLLVNLSLFFIVLSLVIAIIGLYFTK